VISQYHVGCRFLGLDFRIICWNFSVHYFAYFVCELIQTVAAIQNKSSI